MMPTSDHRELRARMTPLIPPGLTEHIDRVVTLAAALAERHAFDGATTQRLLLAAQGHDLLRALEPAELLARAVNSGLEVDPVERAAPVLLHGPLAAEELCAEFGLCDPWVLHAVRWHTSGHPDFDDVAWAFFIADKVEPWKVEQWPALQSVLDAAWDSPVQAALRYLKLNIERGEARGWQQHPMALSARRALSD
jgi:HD superfamily phosphohydrolase YqeK